MERGGGEEGWRGGCLRGKGGKRSEIPRINQTTLDKEEYSLSCYDFHKLLNLWTERATRNRDLVRLV